MGCGTSVVITQEETKNQCLGQCNIGTDEKPFNIITREENMIIYDPEKAKQNKNQDLVPMVYKIIK